MMQVDQVLTLWQVGMAEIGWWEEWSEHGPKTWHSMSVQELGEHPYWKLNERSMANDYGSSLEVTDESTTTDSSLGIELPTRAGG
jgi:hypothetical protein